MNRIKPGSRVSFRFFNTPENKFYGDFHEGIVELIEENHQFSNGNVEKGFLVRSEGYHSIFLRRKEIKKFSNQ